MRRHLIVSTFLVLGGALWGTTTADAQGPPIVNTTDHFANEPDTFIDVHPCTGQAAEITTLDTGVIHFAAFADGTVHLTGTIRSTFSADLLPTDGIPDATGTVVGWFGGNGLLLEEGGAFGKAQSAFTSNGRSTNADGSTFTFHQNENIVFDPNGDPKVDVIHETAHCL